MATAAIEGSLRTDYSAARHPVSSLAIGPRGWVQAANFWTTGTLCSAFAVGLSRARARAPGEQPPLGPALIGLVSGGLLTCGLFRADPVNGYPPGTPPAPSVLSRPGRVHLAASGVVMVGVPTTAALYARAAAARGDRRWSWFSSVTTGLTSSGFVLACAGFGQVGRLPAAAGAFQRVGVGAGFVWLGILAVRVLRGAVG